MAGRIKRTFSYANVTSTLALFAVMAGTSYAAVTLSRDSVGKRELKDNAVTSAEVKNGSLKAADFAAGTLLTGPRGPQGPQGNQGVMGPQACADGLVCPGTDLPTGGYVQITIDEFVLDDQMFAYRIDCAATCTLAVGGPGYAPSSLDAWFQLTQAPMNPGPVDPGDPAKKSFHLTEYSQSGAVVRKFHVTDGKPVTMTHHNNRYEVTFSSEFLALVP